MEKIICIITILFLLFSCSEKEEPSYSGVRNDQPRAWVSLKIKFDSTQDRLDNYGNISFVPMGHSAQSPVFNSIAVGQISLLTDSNTAYGWEEANFLHTNRSINGMDSGYSCCNGLMSENFTVNESIKPGTYRWIRVSYIYQNYRMSYKINGNIYNGTLASFIQPKTLTYFYKIKDSTYNKYSPNLQGDWALEIDTPGYGKVLRGRTPQGFTTTPNVLYSSAPIPSDFYYAITCKIDPPLILKDGDNKSIIISFCSNKCFEWIDNSDPNYFEPFNGDTIFDLGLRGIKVIQ